MPVFKGFDDTHVQLSSISYKHAKCCVHYLYIRKHRLAYILSLKYLISRTCLFELLHCTPLCGKTLLCIIPLKGKQAQTRIPKYKTMCVYIQYFPRPEINAISDPCLSPAGIPAAYQIRITNNLPPPPPLSKSTAQCTYLLKKTS